MTSDTPPQAKRPARTIGAWLVDNGLSTLLTGVVTLTAVVFVADPYGEGIASAISRWARGIAEHNIEGDPTGGLCDGGTRLRVRLVGFKPAEELHVQYVFTKSGNMSGDVENVEADENGGVLLKTRAWSYDRTTCAKTGWTVNVQVQVLRKSYSDVETAWVIRTVSLPKYARTED